MSRLPPLAPPGGTQHVVQRGHARMPCFDDAEDRFTYLDLLRAACRSNDCAVHAYVLMDTHVHLLLTPSGPGALASMVRALGHAYDAQFNRRHRHTGAVIGQRYRSGAVDGNAQLLACQRNIELNPVRAWRVGEPCAYRWSSHGANAHGDPDPLLTPHAAYMQLGASGADRQAAYRAMFVEAPHRGDTIELRAEPSRNRMPAQTGTRARAARVVPRAIRVPGADGALARSSPAFGQLRVAMA